MVGWLVDLGVEVTFLLVGMRSAEDIKGAG